MAASPFFGLAVIFSGLNYSQWVDPSWIGKVEALIPSLLGFSLGTYVILFSIMSGRLKGALHQVKSPQGVSYLEAINATFFHFIFVQVLALTWAFLFQGTWLFDLVHVLKKPYPWTGDVFKVVSLAGSFVGCFLLVYSILLMIAAALAVYRLALIKDPGEGGKE
ncbi:hypothetical protein RFN25_24510 [Mesorhizobium abyssinicae]|uniref:hypothetical protein n=1 Tax=Mesorhizobium abyssinicae TaxID=1209958 RepID=UPI002A247CD7|nr:hypothetical protein [Mesorhizobium abyssinicae]MDX8436592.1 hypothetical protein [Mesorhizobium abyssinicae]